MPVFFPADTSKPFGYMDPAEWAAYGELDGGQPAAPHPARRGPRPDERVPARRGRVDALAVRDGAATACIAARPPQPS